MAQRNVSLPIDTTSLSFEVATDPAPSTVYETGAHKKNREGVPLFKVDLFVRGLRRPGVITVTIAGDHKGIVSGAAVKPVALEVAEWERGDSHGLNFYVERLDLLRVAKEA